MSSNFSKNAVIQGNTDTLIARLDQDTTVAEETCSWYFYSSTLDDIHQEPKQDHFLRVLSSLSPSIPFHISFHKGYKTHNQYLLSCSHWTWLTSLLDSSDGLALCLTITKSWRYWLHFHLKLDVFDLFGPSLPDPDCWLLYVLKYPPMHHSSPKWTSNPIPLTCLPSHLKCLVK
jgi:hypothetical protein